MTLYINGRFLTRPMTGVERYAYMVCKALADMGINFTIVCPKAPVQSCYDVSNLHIIHYGRGQSHLWEQCILPFFFWGKKDYMVFNFTGLGSILTRRKVITIHDLSFLENPKWFSRGYYWWYRIMTPLTVRTAKHIITVSNFSKKEIRRFYPFVNENDISVVYSAVDTRQFNRQESSQPPAERYVVAVSSLDPRKNFARLIQAFSDINDCKLYIVGSYNRTFTQTEDNVLQQDNIRFLGRVTDEQLLQLYCNASCFIFPSIYEGFGLPPIEAMACGCPVLASDIPVIREVCADAALYFNPLEPKSIKDAIVHFLEKSDHDSDIMRTRGYENVNRFSWEKSAKEIVNIAQRY